MCFDNIFATSLGSCQHVFFFYISLGNLTSLALKLFPVSCHYYYITVFFNSFYGHIVRYSVNKNCLLLSKTVKFQIHLQEKPLMSSER